MGLTNPLKEELTSCVFAIEAPGIVDSMKRRFRYELDVKFIYRDRLKGMQILLSRTQAGPGRTDIQEQEQISRNHVQTIFGSSVIHT